MGSETSAYHGASFRQVLSPVVVLAFGCWQVCCLAVLYS